MGDSDDSNTSSVALGQIASLDTSYAGGGGTSAWSLHWTKADENGAALVQKNPVQYCNTLGWNKQPNTTNSPEMNIVNNTTGANGNGFMDVKSIPPWDLYGNALTDLGQGHTVSQIVAPKGTTLQHFPASTPYTGNLSVGGSVNSDAGNGAQLQIAAWNAVDNAANNIRNGTDSSGTPMNITIYTIGYTGDGGTDGSLLMRVANDVNQQAAYGSTQFSPSQRAGTFYQADDNDGIGQAFNKIKGLLLQISR
jgi:hypothetical protein